VSIQRLENEGTYLAARNDADSDYAPLKAKSLYLTDGTPDVGDVAAALAARKHGRMSIFWDEAELVTGTRTIYRVAGMDYGLAAGAASLINNEMKMSFYCDISNGGFFHFHVLTNNGSGIMSASIDGTSIGTVDLYTVAQTLNVDKTLSVSAGAFTLGRHTLRLKGATKHASSSGYALVVTKVWFYDGSD